MKKFLIIFLLFSACEDRDETFIEPSLQSYLDLFVYEAALRGKNINPTGYFIRFEEGVLQKYGGIGATIKNNKKQDLILFDKKYFEENPNLLEWVFFHEGGHAWLNKDHEQQKFSIMNTTMRSFDFKDYQAPLDREYLLDDLFK